MEFGSIGKNDLSYFKMFKRACFFMKPFYSFGNPILMMKIALHSVAFSSFGNKLIGKAVKIDKSQNLMKQVLKEIEKTLKNEENSTIVNHQKALFSAFRQSLEQCNITSLRNLQKICTKQGTIQSSSDVLQNDNAKLEETEKEKKAKTYDNVVYDMRAFEEEVLAKLVAKTNPNLKIQPNSDSYHKLYLYFFICHLHLAEKNNLLVLLSSKDYQEKMLKIIDAVIPVFKFVFFFFKKIC